MSALLTVVSLAFSTVPDTGKMIDQWLVVGWMSEQMNECRPHPQGIHSVGGDGGLAKNNCTW